jgi:2-pyrone-4,6-dicarboxylate lactonase
VSAKLWTPSTLEASSNIANMNSDILVSEPMRGAHTLSPPTFPVPSGACDSHVHVFGPQTSYPSVKSPHYTLPDASLPQLQNMARALNLQRFVIVQPSFYGTDNSCMLDALDTAGARARGVAMVNEQVSAADLQAMHLRGVRALRLDLFLRSGLPVAELIAYIERSVRRIESLGWHVQFYTPGWVIRNLMPFLTELQTDFVVDHMGYMLESDGLTRNDFDRLLRVIADGRGWIKLSAPYRLARDGNFERLRPLVTAVLDAAPSRVIWGSDWPHIPHGSRDTGALLNLLADWVPDAQVTTRVLVNNPARLFGFGE